MQRIASVWGAAYLGLVAWHGAATAATAIGGGYVGTAEGNICSLQGFPAIGTTTYTCQEPNRAGGWALISGIPSLPNASPNLNVLDSLVNTNVGAGAILVGNTSTRAVGTNSIAIGGGAQALATGSVALGAAAISDRAGLNGQPEAFSNVPVSSQQGATSVGSPGNERQIANVAGGTQPTDAVNVRQLEAVANAQMQTSQQVYANRRIASTGTAIAVSAASMPPLEAGKTIGVGVGVGSYDGQSAASVGLAARISESLQIKLNVGTGSGGKTAVGAGGLWSW